jgi:DNA-binding LacI/PurR family transcriptional regulator
MTRLAVEMLLKIISGENVPELTLIYPDLVIRKS